MDSLVGDDTSDIVIFLNENIQPRFHRDIKLHKINIDLRFELLNFTKVNP